MTETIIFMGTPDFSVPILKELHEKYHVAMVVSQPDKPVGRKRILTSPPVAETAKALDIPLFQPDRIRNEDALDRIREIEPDLIITAAYGQILPKALLDIPRLGAINVHASLLPRHRGGAPIHRAIMEGDSETGVTLMYMAEGLDSGNIISSRSTPITDQDDTGTLHDRLSGIGADLLMDTLPDILQKKNDSIPQDDDLVTVSPNISKSDERIDWSKGAREVFNHIRGLSPWPGAYTEYDGKRLKIYEARPSEGASGSTPGTIVDTTPDGIRVACGDGGTVEITAVQLAGKKRTKAVEFAAGRQINGIVLGQVE
ncbi:methionyl-tRNA formyltransferase [Salinicoccus sp. ID82-1]|uniref:Methionyl-tRNA formyltransferase n=1 Tax=Salinicoccus cyprini TaxID=2493691 RepID=A0A558AY18_9STAP|nr:MULTISPECIES: methionyl-tRNA formyltransferase [Salinicoccus]MCG1008673.1 methionyl-tRNA formyltransferase [Salinicoccus sp. ID82-1]TVT29150.1 methionyl-tRNA formyltransferase [Salinicoccus cyprini]